MKKKVLVQGIALITLGVPTNVSANDIPKNYNIQTSIDEEKTLVSNSQETYYKQQIYKVLQEKDLGISYEEVIGILGNLDKDIEVMEILLSVLQGFNYTVEDYQYLTFGVNSAFSIYEYVSKVIHNEIYAICDNRLVSKQRSTVVLDEYNFPDEKLRLRLGKALNIAEGDSIDSDSVTSLTLYTGVLSLAPQGISDITGLEHFTNLTDLWINTNNISDISPIQSLTELKKLCLEQNPINTSSYAYLPTGNYTITTEPNVRVSSYASHLIFYSNENRTTVRNTWVASGSNTTRVTSYTATKSTTITIDTVTLEEKIYDGTTRVTVSNITFTGLPSGVTLQEGVDYTVTATLDNNETGNANATVTVTLLNPSYTLNKSTHIVNDIQISKAPLSIDSVVVSDKIFDGTTNANISSVTLRGLQNNETLELGTDYIVTGVFEDENVGSTKNVTVTIELLNTDKANNYELTNKTIITQASIIQANSTIENTIEMGTEFTYGDIIEIKVEPEIVKLRTLDTVQLIYNNEILATGSYNPTSNKYVLEYDTSDKKLPISDNIPVTIKFTGNSNLISSELNTTIALKPRELSATYDLSYIYDNKTTKETTLSLNGVIVGDIDTIDATLTLDENTINVGSTPLVTKIDYTISSSYYRLDESNITGNITIYKADLNDTISAYRVKNKLGQVYRINIEELLPKLVNTEYGDISYKNIILTDKNTAYFKEEPTLNGNLLELSIDEVYSETEDLIGKVIIEVSSTNYNDFNLTIDIYSTNKETPTLSVDDIKLVYGDTLRNAEIKYNSNVDGNLIILENLDEKRDAGSYLLEAEFIPNDTNLYNTVSVQIKLEVGKATPVLSVSPTILKDNLKEGMLLSEVQFEDLGKFIGYDGGIINDYTISWENPNEIVTLGNSYKYVLNHNNYTFTGEITIFTENLLDDDNDTGDSDNNINKDIITLPDGTKVPTQYVISIEDENEDIVLKISTDKEITKSNGDVIDFTNGGAIIVKPNGSVEYKPNKDNDDNSSSDANTGNNSSYASDTNTNNTNSGTSFNKSASITGNKEKEDIQDNLISEVGKTSFTDTSNHWANSYIADLYNKGIITGYPDGTFRPDNYITRADVGVITHNFLKYIGFNFNGSENIYTDLGNDKYYSRALLELSKINVIVGYGDNTVKPNNTITREEICVVLSKVLDLLDVNINLEEQITFIDEDRVSWWAKESVKEVLSSGLISGYLDETFRPSGYITRAEFCSIVFSLLEIKETQV